ncbi:MAG: PilT/PilU family type 4a pilus ATPase [Planctomycetota bacterium]
MTDTLHPTETTTKTPPVAQPTPVEHDAPYIYRLLGAMPKLNASDLHLKVGIPPTYRISGRLKPINAPVLTAETADEIVMPLMTDKQKADYAERGNLDFAWLLADGPHKGERFRINLYRSGGHTHGAFRRVNAKIPSYGDLHLPPVYHQLVDHANQGLVLVVGITGSGKSSTLAAMVDQVNASRALNIITIEDPVEYRFTPKKSIISQREIGIDVPDFPTALRYVVRQDPDVILVGEMRDKETVLAAIQAAETGHLVFATLHTADTMQAFGRILEFFPEAERGFVRAALSSSLHAICAQKLIPAVDGFEVGVVPATEVLLANSTVREKIREGEEDDLPSIINSSEGEGMHSFTSSFYRLVKDDWVDLVTAKHHAPNREALDSMVKGVSVKAQTLVSRVKSPR